VSATPRPAQHDPGLSGGSLPFPIGAFVSTITPYYEDEWATIYHGDCRDLLPSLTADVCLTDLPYAIGVEYGSYEDTEPNLDALVAEALPLMRQASPVVALTCGIGNWWRFPRPTWVLCWYQNNSPTASGKWGFNQWQPILVYGTDPYLKRQLGRRSDVVAVGASGTDLVWTREAGHPCPKPLGAWKAILRRVSPAETDVVLDPFMGSGTSLVASKYTGRRAIGIEVDERYCEIAARRLGQEVLDLGA
jgi:site-specific DNA-methyltransferase (adenine-specific)